MKKIFLFLVFLFSAVSFLSAQEIEKSTPTKVLSEEEIGKWQKEEIEKMRKRVPGMIKTVEKRIKQIEEGKAKDPRKEKFTEEEAEFIAIDLNHCIYGLGEARDPKAVPYLSKVLVRDPEPALRKTSAWALGVIGSTEAVPALRKALEDENNWVVLESVFALIKLGEKEIPFSFLSPIALGEIDFSKWINNTDIPKEEIARRKKEDPRWEKWEENTVIGLRWRAIEGIYEIGDERSLLLLEKLQTDSNDEIRGRAQFWAEKLKVRVREK